MNNRKYFYFYPFLGGGNFSRVLSLSVKSYYKYRSFGTLII